MTALHPYLAATSPLRSTDEQWGAYLRKVRASIPPWGFERGFVTEIARDHLPRVLGVIGIGKLLGRISPYAKAIVGRHAPMCALPLDPDGRWMLFRLEPDSRDLLALDEWSHAWRCPSLSQLGEDLIDLGAWRWAVSTSKAAFRIARVCGRKRPVP